MNVKGCIINILKITYVFLIFISSCYLFWHQAFTTDILAYQSDLPSHIAFAMKGESYSLLYVVMGLILQMPGNVYVLFSFEALLVLGAGWFAYLFLKEMLPEKHKDLAFFIGFSLLFLTSIYVPKLYAKFYAYTIITQPWHNITYIGMRFFTMWTMYSFFKFYESYLDGISFKKWLSVAIPLLIATAIKPNFLLSFSFALLIVLIKDFVKDYTRFWNIVKMGTTVFPACFVLLIQAIILYFPGAGGEVTSSVVIKLGGHYWFDGIDIYIGKIACGLVFPALIYIWHYKKLDKKTRFVYLMFLVTFIQIHLLTESGKRFYHGNFTWGIYSASFLLFIFAIGKFIKMFDEKGKVFEKVLGLSLLTWHLISGISYYVLLLQGQPSCYI